MQINIPSESILMRVEKRIKAIQELYSYVKKMTPHDPDMEGYVTEDWLGDNKYITGGSDQTLTDPQKQQARENIGAAGVDDAGASYTPTLDNAPTESTTTYIKDGKTKTYEVGQFCRVPNVQSDNGYDLYQLYDLTNEIAKWQFIETDVPNITLDGTVITVTDKDGNTDSIDLAAATDERVYITITSSDGLLNVEGINLDVYINNADIPQVITTNASGIAYISIPNTAFYRIVFPELPGYYKLGDITHTAVVNQRTIDVEYQDIIDNGCKVTISAYKKVDTSITPIEGKEYTVRIDNRTTSYFTDESGVVTFYVQRDKSYTVNTEPYEGYYLTENPSGTYVADTYTKTLLYFYKSYNSGLFIVDNLGDEYTLDAWEEGVGAGTLLNENAKVIKVATDTLATYNGIFGLDIDFICSGTIGSAAWQDPNNVLLETIPANGNAVTAQYYYDGYGASNAISSECLSRGFRCPAVSTAMTYVIQINGEPHQGFLGSMGQWSIIWANLGEIDDILRSVRPNTTRVLSNINSSKWTSTQNSANYVWKWATAATNDTKASSYSVVPLFAF